MIRVFSHNDKIFTKGWVIMDKIYSDLIEKGLKTIDDVHLRISDKVKQELIKRGREDLAEKVGK